MRLHILGICGTFMGGLAQLAREAGFKVTGSDENVYPPMSDLLRSQGIEIIEGYEPDQLTAVRPDLVVVGNVMSRGRPIVEAMLNLRLPFVSGPQWLGEHLLQGRWVSAVAGTHGKTTTASMLAHVAQQAGLNPGFLIGGVAENFSASARLTDSSFFVIEADEYDTAFFDKRSKFVHYRPVTAVLNNLEFDHADIFDDLAAIERQFHHFVRLVPGNGCVVANASQAALQRVLKQGYWSELEWFGEASGWHARDVAADGSGFEVWRGEQPFGRVSWDLLGQHNVSNALATVAAARHMGIPAATALQALESFVSPKRRMERRGTVSGVTVFDDFAHHPTAIETTLAGLKAHHDGRVLVVFEPRSNTMRLGVHQGRLAASWAAADAVFLLQPQDLDWDLSAEADRGEAPWQSADSVPALVDRVVAFARPGDAILVMSNGGFGGIHQRLLAALEGLQP